MKDDADATTGGEATGDGGQRAVVSADLRQQEANFFRSINASPDALLIHQQHRILYANPQALALFGYASLSELLGRSLFDIVSTAYRALVADQVFQTYLRGVASSQVEERLLHRDGHEIPAEVVAIPLVFGGAVVTILHIRDISARKELEVRLRAEDRLASVGLMTAGIAHEINNPLTYALCNVELLRARIDALPPTAATAELREMLASIQEGVGRAAHVTREVTLFSRREHDRTATMDINRVLDSCASLASVELRGRARLVKNYGAVPPVRGSARRLGQVFLNLLINAAQAIPRGNEGENLVTVTTSTEGRDSVVVEVRDTGKGIPADLIPHVFEPLFTTKSEGSGLGLSISRALVAEDGGTISIESTVGRGTCVRVVLQASPTVDVPQGPKPERVRSAGKHILIVDDEPNLTRTLELVLDSHVTTVAASGREALERIRAGAHYDLILCDVSMRDIDGIAFYEQVRSAWPGLESRVVFTSGDAFTPRTNAFFSTIENHIIEKPFEAQQLLDIVDSVLEKLPAVGGVRPTGAHS